MNVATLNFVVYYSIKDEEVTEEEANHRFISSLRCSYDKPVVVIHRGKSWMLPTDVEENEQSVIDSDSIIVPTTNITDQQQACRLKWLASYIIRMKAMRRQYKIEADLNQLRTTLYEMLLRFCQRMKAYWIDIESLPFCQKNPRRAYLDSSVQCTIMEEPVQNLQVFNDLNLSTNYEYGYDDFILPPTPVEVEFPTTDNLIVESTVCLHGSNRAHEAGVNITTYHYCGCLALKVMQPQRQFSSHRDVDFEFYSKKPLENLARRLAKNHDSISSNPSGMTQDHYFTFLSSFVARQQQNSLLFSLSFDKHLKFETIDRIPYASTAAEWYLQQQVDDASLSNCRILKHHWSKRILAMLHSRKSDEEISQKEELDCVRLELQAFVQEDRIHYDRMIKQLHCIVNEKSEITEVASRKEMRRKRLKYAEDLSADIIERNRLRRLSV